MFNYWIFTVILAIIFIILGFILDREATSDAPLIVLTWVFLIYLIFSLGMRLEAATWELGTITYKEVTKDIITLRDDRTVSQNSSISGNIFFIYGKSVSEEGIYYYTIIGTEEEGYLIKKLDSTKTYLFLDGNDQQTYTEKYEIKELIYDGNFMFGKFFKFKKSNKLKEELIKTELHIPKNSIEVEYEINLK